MKYAESDVQRAVRKANNHPNRKQMPTTETESQTISIQTSTIQITNSASDFNDLSEYNNNKMDYYNNNMMEVENNSAMDIESNNAAYYTQLSPTTSQYYYFYVPVCVPLQCSSSMQPFYSPPTPSFYYTK